ncbi:hypothetical protein [Stackebrandtia soli]|uniref:hypothetical protein n=1 Tax=Stackebrandtia soli TaxID=1892856 RepID=UPI0039ECE100
MTDTGNRILWTIVGALLLVVGALAVVVATGVWPLTSTDATVLPETDTGTWADAPAWVLALPVAFGVLLAVLGLWLFARELLPRGESGIEDQTLDDEPARGRTRVDSSAVVTAWQRDIAAARSIARARARLTGSPPRPNAWLRIDLAPSGTVEQAREHVDETLERLATTANWRPGRLDVTIRPARGDQRVH